MAASVKSLNSTKIFVNFFSHRLTSFELQKHNRNIFDLLKGTSMDIFELTFLSRLGGLKRLHGKISSRQSGIPAVQKRDPVLR